MFKNIPHMTYSHLHGFRANIPHFNQSNQTRVTMGKKIKSKNYRSFIL